MIADVQSGISRSVSSRRSLAYNRERICSLVGRPSGDGNFPPQLEPYKGPNMRIGKIKTRFIGTIILAAVLCGLACLSTAQACTGIRLMAKDGTIICARTMEIGIDLKSNLIIVPQGRAYVGTAPEGALGLHWTTKYGFVGPNAFDMPYVCDGLNEKGLAVGNFIFAGTAGYQKIEADDVGRTIASHEVAVYLLGTCANVQEAVIALQAVRVCMGDIEPYNFLGPLHYMIHDAEGNCVVVEYVDGQMNVHANPLGVVTNSPTFDWHVTNLRNYIHLSARTRRRSCWGARNSRVSGKARGWWACRAILLLPRDSSAPWCSAKWPCPPTRAISV